jgi:ABC-type Fe3+ transport system permease subunit
VAIRHHALSWREILWTVSGILLGVTLDQLAVCVWRYLLHRQLTSEQEVILFAACLIPAVIGALLIGMRFRENAKQYRAGYDTKPRREGLLWLLLNGGATVLLYFLLRWQDLHRLQN